MEMFDGEQDDVLYDLATLIAAYSNPHIFYDLQNEPPEIILNELDALKNIMREIIG